MRRIPTFVIALALAGSPCLARGQAAVPKADGPAEPAVPAQAADEDVRAYDHGDKRPGQSQRLPRSWEGAPALIPHAIKGLTPIGAKRNACVGCHGRPGATSGPPPAPASHFVDLREAPGTARPQVAGSRWNCTACHVPQTNAPALR
jgi:nitrate reductase cytochrome c-type subunit